MNETDHVFPLPELEQHKLDEMKEELVHPAAARRPNDLVRKHIWKMAGLALVTGTVCGFLFGRTQ